MKYEDTWAKSILYLDKISIVFCFMFSEALLKSSEKSKCFETPFSNQSAWEPGGIFFCCYNLRHPLIYYGEHEHQ